MRQIQTPFPPRPTPPFMEGDGVVMVSAKDCPGSARFPCRDGITYVCRTATGTIRLQLPAYGQVRVVDGDGSAVTYNVTIYPAKGHTISSGTVNEAFAIDVNNLGLSLIHVPHTKKWSAT